MRSLATNPNLLYPQSAILMDPTSPSEAGSSHRDRGSRMKSSNIVLPYEDEEARHLRDQVARALQEAMETDCNCSRHGSGSFQRPGNTAPTILSRPIRMAPLPDLARQTTLPSASVAQLSPLPSSSASYCPDNALVTSPCPALIPQSAPSRTTSIDTLRTIQSRSLHLTAPSEAKNSLSSGWWFQHKQDVEPLLDDRDKGDAEGSAEDKLRKRCEHCSRPRFLYHALMISADTAPKEVCVLAHGLLGFDSVSVATVEFSYWRGIKEALEAIGCEVLVAKVRYTWSSCQRSD